jgi:tripartite-type tricarboxylate transporter receptor subunit TctC
MTPTRRHFLRIGTAAAALPSFALAAGAEAYPSRPVRIVVPFPAGNASDSVARLTAEGLAEELGQSFIVDNRPGAGGNIGTEVVVKASADGYTLLSIGVSAAINATLYDNLAFNFIRDIAPVVSIARAPSTMVVHPSLPVTTVPEFIAYAKANPGKINMASTGNGSASHVFGELFKMMAGVDLLHVPYRGSFMPDLLAGRVQVLFGPVPVSIEFVRSGKLRALGVTSTTRLDVLPDVPAIAEFVPGYEANGWYGVGAPINTPAEIIDRLNAAINKGLADPKMKPRLSDIGAIPTPMTPTEFGAFLAAETEKWGKVIRTGNIKPD